VNLTEWAHAQGIHVTTAYRWYRKGTLPVPAQKVGRLIPVSPGTAAGTAAGSSPQGGAGLYARVSSHNQKAGLHLGSLAGRDLAARCAEGRLDAKGKTASRARRKRALTAESSSRWAGAITRTSEDQHRLAWQNLRAGRAALQARIRRVEARLLVPAGGKAGPSPAPSLDELRAAPVLAVDLNHGHLATWALTPDGNPAGPPVTIPLVLAGLPAPQRDGRLRAAISSLIRLARQRGCRAVVIEDLAFTAAREQGREHSGSRPGRGRPGRGFRRLVAGIPTGKFRDRLTQMAANAGISVIAVDPAYTSRWGREHWLAPLQEQASPVPASGHAAAVVIGRRALGHQARRRAGVTGGDQRISRRGAAPRAPVARQTTRNGRPREAQRQPPRWRKTATAGRTHPPDQATQDRSGPPASRDYVLLAQQERSAVGGYRQWVGR
jgi:IS605 OrfB family transposase